jgi:hypothetical protein
MMLRLLLLIPSCAGLALRPLSMTAGEIDRRGFGTRVVGAGGLACLPRVAAAEPIPTSGAKVFVAGATGQTG